VLVLSDTPRLGRKLLLGILVLCRLAAAQAPSDQGTLDPEFDKVPFAQWLSGAQQTQMKWSEHVLPVILSVHQRLIARVQIQIDGGEAAKRRGEGDLIFYFQLTDAKGRMFQDHSTYDLGKAEEGLKAQDISCTDFAFVLPGDYSVSVAIYDTATREHVIKKDKLHVAPLKLDPLPDMWRDLPPVEFLDNSDPPDHWFLPKTHGTLHLELTARHPVRIEVLVNLTPTEMSARLNGVQSQNLSLLLPALKAVAQMSGHDVSTNVSLLDLSRRRVVFHQEDVHELDWGKVKSSLSDAGSGIIDVKSLADRSHSAAFFVHEVARKLAPAESVPNQARAVIVLSAPMVFDADQDLQGVELKPSPNSRVFYVRFENPPDQRVMLYPDTRRRRGAFGGYPSRQRTPEDGEVSMPNGLAADHLAPTLKALDPRVFDAVSADQFRKALAAIMSEISSM
jgi:hypothetical protein